MCPKMDSQFVQLEKHELEEISKDLLQRLPRAYQFINVIRLSLRVQLKLEWIFYKWTSTLESTTSGYVACVSSLTKKYWVILEPSTSEAIELMMSDFSLNFVDWKMSNSFNALPVETHRYLEAYCPKLTELAIQAGIATVRYMPLDVACNLDTSQIPNGVTVRKLQREDIWTVFKNWKYSQYHGDFNFVAEAAEQIGSVGLFVKEAANEKLVSWGIEFRDGGIHAVETLVEYRGCGYGKFVMKYLSKLIAQRGQFPIVHIDNGNTTSVGLMSGIGFIYSHDIIWGELNLTE